MTTNQELFAIVRDRVIDAELLTVSIGHNQPSEREAIALCRYIQCANAAALELRERTILAAIKERNKLAQ